jgi:hypothetical protein
MATGRSVQEERHKEMAGARRSLAVALRSAAMAGAFLTRYDATSLARGGGMKKRSKAASKPAKARPRKAVKLKGAKASEAIVRRGSAPTGQTEVARLARELSEARQQQTATSSVLQAISLATSLVALKNPRAQS